MDCAIRGLSSKLYVVSGSLEDIFSRNDGGDRNVCFFGEDVKSKSSDRSCPLLLDGARLPAPSATVRGGDVDTAGCRSSRGAASVGAVGACAAAAGAAAASVCTAATTGAGTCSAADGLAVDGAEEGNLAGDSSKSFFLSLPPKAASVDGKDLPVLLVTSFRRRGALLS